MSEELDEELDSQNQPSGEDVKTEDTDEAPSGDAEESIEALKEKNKKLFERAKAAESKLKERKATATPPPKAESNLTNNLSINPEAIAKEVRLLASLSDEEIAKAKEVQKITGNIETAITHELFTSWQKSFKEKEKKEKAKLGASRGSSQIESDSFSKPMTPEEHKLAWKKRYGQ